MFGRILFLFIAVPLVELYLLLRLASTMGVVSTVALVVITGLIGSYLARREGLTTLQRCRESMAAGKIPTGELQDGLMIVFAAALLLTPGMLTDAVGFSLLTKPGRNFFRHQVLKRLFAGGSIQFRTFGSSSSQPLHPGEPLHRSEPIDAGRPRTIDATTVRHKTS